MRPRSEKESVTFYFSVQKLCPCQWFTEVKLPNLTWRAPHNSVPTLLSSSPFLHTHHLRLLLSSSSSHAYFSSAFSGETFYHLLCLSTDPLASEMSFPLIHVQNPYYLKTQTKRHRFCKFSWLIPGLWPDFQGSQSALIYLYYLILYIIIPPFICLFLLDDEHLWSNTDILNFKMLQNNYLFPASSSVNAGCRNACPLYGVMQTADAVSACNTRLYYYNSVPNILSGPQNWGTLSNSSFILPFPSKSLGHSRFSMNMNTYPRDRTAPSFKEGRKEARTVIGNEMHPEKRHCAACPACIISNSHNFLKSLKEPKPEGPTLNRRPDLVECNPSLCSFH